MSRPDRYTLTDEAAARVSMPFLPTLAVVIALGAASLYCPSPRQAVPAARAAAVPAPGAFTSAALAAPAAAALPARPPAPLAFAEVYPAGAAVRTDLAPTVLAQTALAPITLAHAAPAPESVPRPAAARPASHLAAAAARRPCPGRRCPETPLRGPETLDPARAGASGTSASETAETAEDALPPLALPFASVAESLAPAARAVGRAADFLSGGAATVKGSVALAVADCLR